MSPALSTKLEQALKWACVLPLAVILIVTFIDVFMRYFFAHPITGSTEIIRFSMALAVFAGLPLLTRDRGHITVSLVDNLLKPAALQIKQFVCDLISLIALALLAWRLWDQAQLYIHNKTATIVLDWPIAPLTFALFGFAVLTVILLAATMLNSLLSRPKTKEES